jgi:very-short-patch-repair endonuclease
VENSGAGGERNEEWEREHAARLMEAQRRQQDGVLSHAQLTAGGVTRADLIRMQRRKEIVRVHPRVYVDHTGPLTWHQRAWAAVLYAGPAYVCGPSVEAPRSEKPLQPGMVPDPIHVAIDQTRRVMPQPGIVIHRITNLEAHAYGSIPPRLRLEDNALMMAHEARSEIDVIASLAGIAGRTYVTAASLRGALSRFPSLRRRAWIAKIIDDLESGTNSVLEHGYLIRIERPHGLPQASRQAVRTTSKGNQFRDVEYAAYGLVVELDGALGHDTWRDQARDADRMLDDLAATGTVTARLRWHQVFDTPCRTTLSIVKVLKSRGWTGTPTSCGDQCSIASEP